MKKYVFLLSVISFLGATTISAQDLSNSEVPSIIRNSFLGEYPQATDIEWEREGDLYKVDFELNKKIEQKIWYDPTGEIVKREEEMSATDLPTLIHSKIKTEFAGYHIDEVDKVTTKTEVYYQVELESFFKEDWEITINAQGKILSKVAD